MSSSQARTLPASESLPAKFCFHIFYRVPRREPATSFQRFRAPTNDYLAANERTHFAKHVSVDLRYPVRRETTPDVQSITVLGHDVLDQPEVDQPHDGHVCERGSRANDRFICHEMLESDGELGAVSNYLRHMTFFLAQPSNISMSYGKCLQPLSFWRDIGMGIGRILFRAEQMWWNFISLSKLRKQTFC